MRNKNEANEGPKERLKMSGMTIIEVLVSLFMVGVALLLMHASVNSLLINRNAKHQELAARIAASQMEELRNTTYLSLPGSGSFTHPLLINLPQGEANMTLTNFNATTKEISVVVSWREPDSTTTRNVTLTSLITQNGL